MLESQLEDIQDDNTARQLIMRAFKELTFNNHSFLAFLYDELCESHFNEIRLWNKLNPNPIVLYRGTLYRGEDRGPYLTDAGEPGIFKTGFEPLKKIHYIEQAICVNTGSYGVSTSKDFNKVKHYPYVYKIEYYGTLGVDVCATQSARGGTLIDPETRLNLSFLKEVNILGYVPPHAIKGCLENKRFLGAIEHKTYKNGNFNNEMAMQENQFTRERLACAFNEPGINIAEPEKAQLGNIAVADIDILLQKITHLCNAMDKDKQSAPYQEIAKNLQALKAKSDLLFTDLSEHRQFKAKRTLELTYELSKCTLDFLEQRQEKMPDPNAFKSNMHEITNKYFDIMQYHKSLWGKIGRALWEITLCVPIVSIPFVLFYTRKNRGGLGKTDTEALVCQINSSCGWV